MTVVCCLKTFVVATFNIRAGRGLDNRRDLKRIANTLRGADFVGMQEVDEYRLRSGFVSQITKLGRYLGHSYHEHFYAKKDWFIGRYGNAVTTCFNVIRAKKFTLPRLERKYRRALVWVCFTVGDKLVHAFVIHGERTADRTGLAQWPQISYAISTMEDITKGQPYIFMGDFNTPHSGKVYEKLSKKYADASAVNPSFYKLKHRDYIFVKGLDIEDAWHIENGSSDHPAVFARLSFK